MSNIFSVRKILTLVLLEPHIRFQANLRPNKIPPQISAPYLVVDAQLIRFTTQYGICLFSINNIIFHSFEAGNCVSNSSFKWMKNTHIQFSSTRVEHIASNVTSLFVTLFSLIIASPLYIRITFQDVYDIDRESGALYWEIR